MKIVFPESTNPIIREAVNNCSEIDMVEASDLETGCKVLSSNDADAMIVGIDNTTRDVLSECQKMINLTDKYFTSCFILEKDGKKLILADGGVCKKIDADVLCAIVIQTHKTAARILDDEPKIAMLSFSTFGSGGEDETITMIHEAITKAKTENPAIIIDGEMQLDAAISPIIGNKKAGNSLVAGKANVLICPDLNSGNILYKGLEQLGGWTVAGPILQGFAKPISDLSRGSSVKDVELTIKMIEKLI